MIIAIDTETTGLIDWKKPMDHPDQPRMVSLAVVAFSDDGEREVGQFYSTIRPEGFVIDNNSKACQVNGITQEMAMEYGIKASIALSMMDAYCFGAKYILFFNAAFDTKIIANEIDVIRRTKPDRKNWLEAAKIRCMKVAYTSLVKLPPNPGYSDHAWPSLDQAYEWMYGSTPEGAHNSLADARNAAFLAFDVIKEGLWDIVPRQVGYR